MEKIIKIRKDFYKIVVLVVLFIAFLSISSAVKAATKTESLELTRGIPKTINPGITTQWGGIKSVTVKEGKTIVSVSQTGTQSKNSTLGKIKIKINPILEGDAKVEVQFYRNFYAIKKETVIYEIKVKAPEPTSVSIKTMPTKTKYTVGDQLDKTGLSINVKYNNGETKVISAAISCEPTELLKEGEQTITVIHQGKKATFKVNVCPKKDEKLTNNPTNNPTGTYTTGLKVGEVLKLKKGSKWNIYKETNRNSSKTTISGETTVTISNIKGNWITIKENKTYKYLYYGSTAAKYFSKVTGNNDTSDSSIKLLDNQGKELKVGDTIKMTKGNSWWVYTNTNLNTRKTTIKKGNSFKIVSIQNHAVGINLAGTTCYIKWYNSSTGAKNYFEVQ